MASDSPQGISLVLPCEFYTWTEGRWMLHGSGQVSVTPDRVSIRSEESTLGNYPLLGDKYWDLKPHSGSDRGWTCNVLVGSTEEQRIALRLRDPASAKRFKDVLSEYRKSLGLCPLDENSLAALLSQLGHEGSAYPDLAQQVRSRALSFLQRDSLKSLRLLLTRRLSSSVHRWHSQSLLSTAALQYRKLRTYAVKLTRELKDSQRVKIEIKSARPIADSKIPVPRIATEKLSEERHRERGRSRSITKDKENERIELPRASEAKDLGDKLRAKRPISVPPKRPSEDSLISKVQMEARSKANQMSRRELKPANEADGVGQRLYQQAQEIEKRREMMRRSMEPEYSFTPQISQSTEKWLHKGTKPARAPPQDEVAVVSSASVLSFLNNNSLKDIKLPLAFVTPKSQPLVPLLCTNVQQPVRVTEECLSKRYQEDSSDSHTLSVVEYDPLAEDA